MKLTKGEKLIYSTSLNVLVSTHWAFDNFLKYRKLHSHTNNKKKPDNLQNYFLHQSETVKKISGNQLS